MKDGGMTIKKPDEGVSSAREFSRRESNLFQNLNSGHLKLLASPKFCEEARNLSLRRSRVKHVENTKVKLFKRTLQKRYQNLIDGDMPDACDPSDYSKKVEIVSGSS